MRSIPRATGVAAGLAAGAAALALAPVIAGAVSGGGYTPAQQNCSKTANASNAGAPGSSQPAAYPDCHNFTAQVNQGGRPDRNGSTYGSSWHIVSVNGNQLPNNSGWTEHSGSVVVDPGQGTKYTLAFDTGTQEVLLFKVHQPSASITQQGSSARFHSQDATTWQLYMSADDNLDFGEHDGVNPDDKNGLNAPAANGPSDGGAIQVNTHPGNGTIDPANRHDPVRAADAGTGACADGLCFGADTSHRKAYQGGCTDKHKCPDTAVYNDENASNPNYDSGSTHWRSTDCNSGSTFNQNECSSKWASCPPDDDSNANPNQADGDCDDGPIVQPYRERGGYYTDPGVFVYEDPDPQASPVLQNLPTLGPISLPFIGSVWLFGYPLCELYAGTEGVYLCGNNVAGKAAAAVPAPGPSDRHGDPVHAEPVPVHPATPVQRPAPALSRTLAQPSTAGRLIGTATPTLSKTLRSLGVVPIVGP